MKYIGIFPIEEVNCQIKNAHFVVEIEPDEVDKFTDLPTFTPELVQSIVAKGELKFDNYELHNYQFTDNWYIIKKEY